MDKGQVSIDFLIAISIFVIGLVLLISQVPMLFTPLQTVSTDIQPVAYRTSMILAEDGGICNKGGSLTSEWDDCDPECISRIGLAMKAHGWASSEDIIPNNLSIDKIEALNNEAEMSSNITEKIGLFVTYNGNRLNYSYNISLKAFNGSFITNSTGVPLLQVGDSLPESGATIEKIERIVALSISNATTFNNTTVTIAGHECAKLVVCIWR
jgi:hypothetical protein